MTVLLMLTYCFEPYEARQCQRTVYGVCAIKADTPLNNMLLYQLVAVLAFKVASTQSSRDHGPCCAPDLQVQLMDERSLRKMLNTFEKKVCKEVDCQ